MADNYIGWKMFDKVTIVSRPITKWNYETHENIATGECQGFLVDPKNKKQLESALSWGTSYKYEYTVNEDGQRLIGCVFTRRTSDGCSKTERFYSWVYFWTSRKEDSSRIYQ